MKHGILMILVVTLFPFSLCFTPTHKSRVDPKLALANQNPTSPQDETRLKSSSADKLNGRPGQAQREFSLKKQSNTYSNHVRNLNQIFEESSVMIEQMKTICSIIKGIELDDPSVTKLGMMSSELALALSKAKAADDVFGPNSVESNAAWDIAEIVAAGKMPQSRDVSNYHYREAAISSHHNYMTVVDMTSLENAITAFGKIQHLARLIKMEEKRINAGNDQMRP